MTHKFEFISFDLVEELYGGRWQVRDALRPGITFDVHAEQ